MKAAHDALVAAIGRGVDALKSGDTGALDDLDDTPKPPPAVEDRLARVAQGVSECDDLDFFEFSESSGQGSGGQTGASTAAPSTGTAPGGQTFATALAGVLPASAPYGSFHTVTDDTGALTISIPTAWGDVDGSARFVDEPFAPSIVAAGDLDGFFEGWTEPAAFFGVSGELAEIANVELLLDQIRDNFGLDRSCDHGGRFDYSHPSFSGQYDQFTDCDGEGSVYISLVMEPADGSYLVSLMVQMATLRDAAAFDGMLASFTVLDTTAAGAGGSGR